eukprot:s121_g46.t1
MKKHVIVRADAFAGVGAAAANATLEEYLMRAMMCFQALIGAAGFLELGGDATAHAAMLSSWLLLHLVAALAPLWALECGTIPRCFGRLCPSDDGNRGKTQDLSLWRLLQDPLSLSFSASWQDDGSHHGPAPPVAPPSALVALAPGGHLVPAQSAENAKRRLADQAAVQVMDQLEVLIHGSAEARRLSGEWAAEARRISEEGRVLMSSDFFNHDMNCSFSPHHQHHYHQQHCHRLLLVVMMVVLVLVMVLAAAMAVGGWGSISAPRATAETALDIDKSKPGMPPFPCTQVQRVDDDGEIGRWNEQQRALAGADSPFSPFSADDNRLDDLTVIEPQQEPGNGASGRSVWLQAVEVHGQPGFTKMGEQGLKLLQEVRWRVGGPNAARARLILYFFIQASYCFRFKARDIHGHALHVLAVYDAEPWHRVFGHLLQRSKSKHSACIDMAFHPKCSTRTGGGAPGTLLAPRHLPLLRSCWFIAHNKMGTCEALHLAAGVGNVAFLDFLGEANADVDAKTRFDGKAGSTDGFGVYVTGMKSCSCWRLPNRK